MDPLFITSALLAIGAALDGKSTVDFLTKSKGELVESDPVMVFFFGSDDPTPARMWATGAVLIVAEIGAAFFVSHFWHPAVWAFAVQQLVQAGYHTRCWVNNENVLTSYLNSAKK
jgi:hypothetical protein